MTGKWITSFDSVPADIELLLRELGERSGGVEGEVEESADGLIWQRAWPVPDGRTVLSRVTAWPLAHRATAELTGAKDDAEADLVSRHVAWVLCLNLTEAATAPLIADPALGPWVAAHPQYTRARHPNLLEGLVGTILGQQVTVGAARTARRRLAECLSEDGAALVLRAKALALADPTDLARRVGLTRNKARALASLATGSLAPWLEQPAWAISPPGGNWDEALGTLYGIGPWSIAWLKLLALGDQRAIAPQDLGVQEALQWLYQLPRRPDAAETAQRLGAWQPAAGLGMLYALRALRLARAKSGKRRVEDLPMPEDVVLSDGFGRTLASRPEIL